MSLSIRLFLYPTTAAGSRWCRLPGLRLWGAGVDIVGDKLMEINVFSPGGLGSAGGFTGVDFAAVIIDALAAKLDWHRATTVG